MLLLPMPTARGGPWMAGPSLSACLTGHGCRARKPFRLTACRCSLGSRPCGEPLWDGDSMAASCACFARHGRRGPCRPPFDRVAPWGLEKKCFFRLILIEAGDFQSENALPKGANNVLKQRSRRSGHGLPCLRAQRRASTSLPQAGEETPSAESAERPCRARAKRARKLSNHSAGG